jgi:hypothetical protein
LNNPPPEVSEEIRKNALKVLTGRYLADAERLGADRDEIDQILKDQMTLWQQAGHPVDPDSETD